MSRKRSRSEDVAEAVEEGAPPAKKQKAGEPAKVVAPADPTAKQLKSKFRTIKDSKQFESVAVQTAPLDHSVVASPDTELWLFQVPISVSNLVVLATGSPSFINSQTD
jgi:hypothetical protein